MEFRHACSLAQPLLYPKHSQVNGRFNELMKGTEYGIQNFDSIKLERDQGQGTPKVGKPNG